MAKARKWRKLWISSMICVLGASQIGILEAGAAGQTSVSERPVISENVVPNERIMDIYPLQTIEPSWTLAVDRNENWHATTSAEAVGNQVFALKNKQLVAINASTGKLMWTYGKKLTSTFQYDKGMIYGLSQVGDVYAVRADQGKQKWTAKYTEVNRVIPQGERVYVLHHERKIDALQASTGKLLWSTEEPQAGSTYELMETEGVLLAGFYVQGALSSTQLNAFDLKTGKKKWGLFRQGMPMHIKDGLVYSEYDSWMHDDTNPQRSVDIQGIDIHTGEVKESRQYSYTLPGDPPYDYSNGRFVLNGNDFYIAQGNRVALYDFSKYQKDGKPLKTWQVPFANAYFLNQVHDDKLLFKDNVSREIRGIKMANGQEISWMGDNPGSQVDLYGNVLYRAQTDGVLYGFDFRTTKPIFKIRTGAHFYGPTLKSGQMIIIQAENKLIGIRLPASVK